MLLLLQHHNHCSTQVNSDCLHVFDFALLSVPCVCTLFPHMILPFKSCPHGSAHKVLPTWHLRTCLGPHSCSPHSSAHMVSANLVLRTGSLQTTLLPTWLSPPGAVHQSAAHVASALVASALVASAFVASAEIACADAESALLLPGCSIFKPSCLCHIPLLLPALRPEVAHHHR